VPDAVIHYRHRPGLRPLARQSYRYGIGNAELFHRFRSSGLEPSPFGALSGSIWRSLRGVPKAIVNPRKRGAWVVFVSYFAGQLVGGLRHRAIWIG
jgi:hypothetical protein